MWINKGLAQNTTLTVRVDTVTVKFGTKDTLVPIYFGIQGPKPTSFRGYGSYVSFDRSKLGDSLQVPLSMRDSNGRFDTMAYVEYVDSAMALLMFAGTGSASLPPLFALLDTEIRAIELCEQCNGIDLAKPVLYRVHLSMRTVFSDTAFLHLFRFDQTAGAPFSTVNMQDGWIRYARSPLTLSTEAVRVLADSLVTIPVTVSDLTSANVREAAFACTIDTSILKYVGALRGNIPGDSLIIRDSVAGKSITVFITNADSAKALTGNGVLFSLQFEAKSRIDTVCATLRDTSFRVLNSDALLSTVTLSFGEICVEGQTSQGVGLNSELNDRTVDIWPNPFEDALNVRLRNHGNASNRIQIFDALGRIVLDQRLSTDFLWQPALQLSGGLYLIRITGNDTADAKNEIVERQVLLIH